MAKHIEITIGENTKVFVPIDRMILTKNEISYFSDHAELIYKPKESYDEIKRLISTAEQEGRRFQAATAAMQGVMASPLEKVKSLTDPEKAYYAVVMADHLLTQLTTTNS